ncbi:MAG TPA: GspH/FimT family pseudopilin [Rhizomicrobium sp.]|nr:GspH/FimT family pseudopilin [Rhizomicrobium sp.]
MTWRFDRAGLGPQSGFTLIEMIVVIAILGLTLALVGLKLTPVSPASHARAAAEEISGAMRSARGAAVMGNRSVSFTLDLAPPGYRWGGEAFKPLPNDVSLNLLTGRDLVSSNSQGRIRFDPDGGSSGGRVTINGGGQVWIVGVDWLSGRVSIAHNPS